MTEKSKMNKNEMLKQNVSIKLQKSLRASVVLMQKYIAAELRCNPTNVRAGHGIDCRETLIRDMREEANFQQMRNRADANA